MTTSIVRCVGCHREFRLREGDRLDIQWWSGPWITPRCISHHIDKSGRIDRAGNRCD